MNDMQPPTLPSYLQPQQTQKRNLPGPWFRLSCIPEPAPTAPLIQREKYRRARIASIILLLLQLYVITSLPAGFFGLNKFLLVLLAAAFIVNSIAMYCNRKGLVTAAGLMIVGNVTFSTMMNILTTPGGLGLSALPLFDLLVIPLVLCASVLSAYYVFFFAAFNSIFTLFSILYLHHQPDLTAALKTSAGGLISLPIILQFIVAFLAFLWVRSANEAIARADRAEQIALLEHDIAESRQQIAEQKERLEASIQEITQALVSANTGRSFTRIATVGNPLWNIVGPINNMLSRMERMRQTEVEYQQLMKELESLLIAIRRARETQQFIQPAVDGSSARLLILYREIAQLQNRESPNNSRSLPFPPQSA